MKSSVGSGIAAVFIAVTLSMGAGCGNGSSNDNQREGATPTPVRTATPAPTNTSAGPTPVATVTPAGTTASVALHVTASAALLGFQFTATYPTAKGSFAGSADGVDCSTASSGIFTKNDQDNGNLILSVANASVLTFPVTIDCTFDVVGGQNLSEGDIGIANKEVTDEGGAVGDASTLTVSVGVS